MTPSLHAGRHPGRVFLLLCCAALALVFAACGTETAEAEPQPTPSPAGTTPTPAGSLSWNDYLAVTGQAEIGLLRAQDEIANIPLVFLIGPQADRTQQLDLYAALLGMQQHIDTFQAVEPPADMSADLVERHRQMVGALTKIEVAMQRMDAAIGAADADAYSDAQVAFRQHWREFERARDGD